MELELKAYGKINPGLDVLRRREDGYHEVKMIMQTVSLYDVLKFSVLDEDKIELSCSNASLSVDEDNIVYKACRMIKEDYDIKKGIRIHIEKNIPIAGGMAGGSTDGATTLVGMNKIFDLRISKTKLMEYGLRLGADVPFCLMGGTALSEGIGEKLTGISPMPKCYLLIVKPDIRVSTKTVYENLRLDTVTNHPDIDEMIRAFRDKDINKISDLMGNVLETVTIPLHPEIQDIKEKLREEGALNSLMSGSGPTVFGVFEQKRAAVKAKKELKALVNTWKIYLVEPVDICC